MVENLVGEWLAYLGRRNYALTTRRNRASTASRWLAWVGERWREATYSDVEAWAEQLGVTPRSQRTALSHLRAFYRWSIRVGLVDSNPLDGVDMPRVGRTVPRPALDAHIADVIALASPRVAAMVGLMAITGLRCCEVAALDWTDVDLDRGVAVVTGKGAKQRWVFLTDDVVRLLAALDGTAGPVFPGDRRPRTSANRVSEIVCDEFRALGYPTTAHQLRHRAATVAYEQSGDLLAVRDMLGHVDVATTQIYTKVARRRVAEVARAVPLPRS